MPCFRRVKKSGGLSINLRWSTREFQYLRSTVFSQLLPEQSEAGDPLFGFAWITTIAGCPILAFFARVGITDA